MAHKEASGIKDIVRLNDIGKYIHKFVPQNRNRPDRISSRVRYMKFAIRVDNCFIYLCEKFRLGWKIIRKVVDLGFYNETNK